MNIEKLLELERENSFDILKSKAPYMGFDFIEDVYCDARLKAIKHFKSYDPARPFKNWWIKILLNSLTDKINKEKNEVPQEYIQEKTYDPMSHILVNLTLSELIDLLDTLPEKQKSIVKKIIEEETVYNNISKKKSPAERLSLHKARKKISDLLKETKL